MKLIFSIDWEDFGQLSHKKRFSQILPPKSQIDRQTKIILELLDKHNIKGTFFVLGVLAKYKPDLVKLIYANGHEIALHGMNHDNLPSLSLDQIYEDIKIGKDIIVDLIGSDIKGYRAPYFSLINSRLKVLEILSDLEFEYDSSIYPSSFARYSIPDFYQNFVNLSLPNGKTIVELPVTVFPLFGKNIPISGGGYFRILNKQIIKLMYKHILHKEKQGMVYMHPYEFDDIAISIEQYKDEGFSLSKIEKLYVDFKCNLFRKSIVGKMDYLLEKYDFETANDVSIRIKNSEPKTF